MHLILAGGGREGLASPSNTGTAVAECRVIFGAEWLQL